MFRERPSFILVNGMLSIGSRRALDGNLSLLCLHTIGHALLQQAMKLHPVFHFHLSTRIDRSRFQGFSGLIVTCLTRLLNRVNDSGLVERALVIYINLSTGEE